MVPRSHSTPGRLPRSVNDLVHAPVANFTVGATRSSSLLPRRHGHQDPVVRTVSATMAAQLAFEVHEPGVVRPATAEGCGVDSALVAAGGAADRDDVPVPEIGHANGVARRNVPSMFHGRSLPQWRGAGKAKSR